MCECACPCLCVSVGVRKRMRWRFPLGKTRSTSTGSSLRGRWCPGSRKLIAPSTNHISVADVLPRRRAAKRGSGAVQGMVEGYLAAKRGGFHGRRWESRTIQANRQPKTAARKHPTCSCGLRRSSCVGGGSNLSPYSRAWRCSRLLWK